METNYMQVVELTDEEQIKLYFKSCTKQKLAEMLTEANKHLKNLSRVELPVKPEIAETRARIEELERVLRLNVGKGYTVFLMIPRVDITDKITKLKKELAEQKQFSV